MKKQVTHTLDILGISSASLCLIHCLLFPLLSIFPIGISHNHWIDLLFASIGLYAVVKILKTNTPIYIKLILTISMVTILISIFLSLFYHQHSYFLYVGGFGMILGHILNYKSHKH